MFPSHDHGEAGGEEAGGEESPLLAVPPGSRNSPRLTPGAKGKVYYPKRDDRRTGSGPRTRHFNSQYAREKASSATRNVFPGAEINTLAKAVGPSVGIYNEEQSIYKLREQIEEEKLFEISDSVRKLLEGLEIKTMLSEHKNED